MQTKACSQCKYILPITANFCRICGANQKKDEAGKNEFDGGEKNLSYQEKQLL